MASGDSQIDEPQHWYPKRAELLDVNINTGAQSINTERALNIAAVFCSVRWKFHQLVLDFAVLNPQVSSSALQSQKGKTPFESSVTGASFLILEKIHSTQLYSFCYQWREVFFL